MALLSVIIVNYNVRYFTALCLQSVQRAMEGLDGEILVVDNASGDGSMEFLPARFPAVQFIAAGENLGFAKANNLALRQATGSVILFLNPDTILPETMLKRTMSLLLEDERIGALGVRMIDGSGRFLPESKRGFPSPQASFFKLAGLARLFPRSAIFGHYYMGWLPERKNHRVEVLSGAFMMIKKPVLEQAGSFDEQFFMYGEDIDLSYRIIQAGYRNFYYGEEAILHFKGESSRKDSRYTRLFYAAMEIFIQKHYRAAHYLSFRLMKTGIRMGSLAATAGNLFRRVTSAVSSPGQVYLLAGNAGAATAAKTRLGKLAQVSGISTATGIGQLPLSGKNNLLKTVVFDSDSLAWQDIIALMAEHPGKAVYKMMSEVAGAVIGSDTKGTQGEVWTLEETGGD